MVPAISAITNNGNKISKNFGGVDLSFNGGGESVVVGRNGDTAGLSIL